MADSQEGGAEVPASVKSSASVAPGIPININVTTSPPAEKSAKSDKAAAKADQEPAPKRTKSEADRDKKKGANTALKALGLKKGERREVLENLGSGKEEQAKEALIKQLQASRKEAAATREEVAALKPLEERTKTLETRLKKVANEALSGLSDEAQKYVTKRAGDDSAAILDFIEDLRSSGMIKAAPYATAAPDAKKTPSTTLANGTPPIAKPAATLNHHETWQQLKSEGQDRLAANYYHLYGRKIDEQQPK